MENTNIYLKRIKKFFDHVYSQRYSDHEPLEVSYIYDAKKPISYQDALSATYKSIRVGRVWGKLWGSAWFRFNGIVPERFKDREVVALVDTGSEACVFEDGTPVLGLTRKRIGADEIHIKRRVPLMQSASGGEEVSLLVEAGANGLFGANEPDREFILRQAELTCFNREIWQFALDIDYLIQIAEALAEGTPRRNKIIYGLNQIVNMWDEGKGIAACTKILQNLYKPKAADSSLTIWSIGHAHLDLGWLWPVRETRRKGGRTFATALRMIEEYPEYRFGASQPQLYEWIKNDYPQLYQRVKKAIADGTWECQGAMWVEPDMNVTGGEALVRQCLYGKQFYRNEFGVDVNNLWLPDVFGYSAALPQILKKCGVDYFMTQKISWNETNTFPHHTFYWQGIDGTRILTHFLPTNSYNVNNRAKQLIEAEKQFAQNYVEDGFLNLYGTGDGGGGPSRMHIEYGLRAQNTEGVPKVKFAFADDFFRKIKRTNPEDLPVWAGELYLELHRGTYTTQGKMKWYNRKLELQLRNTEFLAALATLADGPNNEKTLVDAEKTLSFLNSEKQDQLAGYQYPKQEIDRVWKDTLLNQFHDILPGSSITWVYEDAHRVSEQNLTVLTEALSNALGELHGREAVQDGKPTMTRSGTEDEIRFVVYNTVSWERKAHITFPLPKKSSRSKSKKGRTSKETAVDWNVYDYVGRKLPSVTYNDKVESIVTLPALGYSTFTVSPATSADSDSSDFGDSEQFDTKNSITVASNKRSMVLENAAVRIKISKTDGTINSIFDKSCNRESLSGPANRLMLWEDIPYNWDAWDISPYYRQTTPVQAVLTSQSISLESELHVTIHQEFTVGNSTISQDIHLYNDSALIAIDNTVEWQEDNKMLRVQAETSFLAPEATYEIQYGTVRRPTHGNTSWDAAKFEVAGHRFADLSQPDYGFAILNDCKYGHYIRDNVVDLTLLRSPKKPDPQADIGTHSFTFAYIPHQNDFTSSKVLEQAHELNNAPIRYVVKEYPQIRQVSYFSFEEDSKIVIEAVKIAEDGQGIILRLYESVGKSDSVTLLSHREWNSITETDMLERPIGRPKKAGSKLKLHFSPYEIKTLRIE